MQTSEEKKEDYQDAIFAAKAEIVLATKNGVEPALKEVNFNLLIPDQKSWIAKDLYLKDELPTRFGVKVLTNIFVQALVANIKAANQVGHWDEKSHFEFVVFELGRAMAANSQVSNESNVFRTNNEGEVKD